MAVKCSHSDLMVVYTLLNVCPYKRYREMEAVGTVRLRSGDQAADPPASAACCSAPWLSHTRNVPC